MEHRLLLAGAWVSVAVSRVLVERWFVVIGRFAVSHFQESCALGLEIYFLGFSVKVVGR